MTQDVQPLTWQKRTNIEEHMQFFSKINEIIDNLAPTVDEAEAAIAQATAAIASANDAVATANAASAAASAAASQAQTAASTVAGYDTRLTAAEGDIDTAEGNITALQGRMTTAEGKITAIEGREPNYLKKTGAAQTVTSQIMVPTTATGTRDTQIANGTRIQNDLDNYAGMLRTTGNQVWTGVKRANATFSHGITSDDLKTNPEAFIAATVVTYVDQMNADTHNSLGSLTRVRNQQSQNYMDLLSTSYGYYENDVQQKIDVFIRLLINDQSGDASLVFYRNKRNADGTGTADTKAKVLATITAAGVIT